jgi:hypothetical protein
MDNVYKSTIAKVVKVRNSDDVPYKFGVVLIGTSVSK